MSILNNTKDGTPISGLSRWSRKKIEKTCDVCGIKLIVSYCDVITAREKWLRRRPENSNLLDFCFTCSMETKNKGMGNPAKNIAARKNISEALLGKSKRSRDGSILRILPYKYSASGYILKFDDTRGKHIPEHRLLIEQQLGRKLLYDERIHHINGIKTNNILDNLYLCKGKGAHERVHASLEDAAFDAVRRGIIVFDPSNGTYKLNPIVDMSTMEISLGFSDVAIKPTKNNNKSRLLVDTKSEFIRGLYIDIPLIASNMSTVINSEFYRKLVKLGSIGILHRALSETEYIEEVKKVSNYCKIVIVSIGVTDNDKNLIKKLIENGANVVCIDIANAYTDRAVEFAKYLKTEYNIKIIIGNTSNSDILNNIHAYVDGIKIGIAQGLACETKNTAGATEKQFSAIYKSATLARKYGIPIISDGSISEPADFVKAIGAGANSVMAGSIFARCPESAAPLVDGKKLYAGMASRYVQERWRGLKAGTCPEGGVRMLDIGEPVERLLERYSGALKSGITYGGGTDIKSFQNNVKFVRVSNNTVIENSAHKKGKT